MSSSATLQEPVAIVSFACRLPGGNSNPHKLWEFIKNGSIAPRDVPPNRFNFKAHYDASNKPKTMRQAGGMFLGDVDLADFDAGFFEVGGSEAEAMDPNQRQLLEVVYEALENAGLPLEKLDNAPVGCFVGSYASDYGDMQARDPEDRSTTNALGVGRTIMANRLSYFLNIKGPSVTLDTACSGSLQGLDLACRYLNTGDINAAIVATSNLYMSPEHIIDQGSVGSAHSPTALCHVFDKSADGYVKAEAVSAVIVKRLVDAVRDRDPIRAVILGTASTSNGRTAGIASPNAESQAIAIRAAYERAGIRDLNKTTYLECHGTGTQAGDPTEVRGAGSVFAATRDPAHPLIIGSIKSNVGHAEPAAGNSGLIKAVLAMENGFIPGTPTFVDPSPKIDFVGNKVRAERTGIPWPADAPRRASVNSFGFGGSNAHVIVEAPPASAQTHYASSYRAEGDTGLFEDEEDAVHPYLFVLSANDELSLRAAAKKLGDHLINPAVKVSPADLAYTLSERRSQLWHRAFLAARNTEAMQQEDAWTVAKKGSQTPRVGFIFTGQGAQWPQMGKDLLQFVPWTRSILEELDHVLQALPESPTWSLVAELTEKRTPEHVRQPEFSQPLVTALQLCLVDVLASWGIRPVASVGHSSGEIGAAYAAGLLDRAEAITVAYYRGRAAVHLATTAGASKDVGMLAVGLGAPAVNTFLETHPEWVGRAWVACLNSPNSVTVSGQVDTLQALAEEVKAAGHFARLLQVDLAYHSKLMSSIGDEYERLLSSWYHTKTNGVNGKANGKVNGKVNGKANGQVNGKVNGHNETVAHDATMFSSVTASKKTTAADALYWKTNMVSPVQFDGALRAMLEDDDAPNMLVELGPSGALAGPVTQILKALPGKVGGDVSYIAGWARGPKAGEQLYRVAGQLWALGGAVDLAAVNGLGGDDGGEQQRLLVDLPNYPWNHTVKYWHENAASRDWRFRKYVVHDLLGSKLLGSDWRLPSWRAHLNVADIPWLLDHKMGGNAIMPGAGYVTMAVEALFQKHKALLPPEEAAALHQASDLCYRLRNVRFVRAFVLEEGQTIPVTTTLAPVPGDRHWHEFHIATPRGGGDSGGSDSGLADHCVGLIRVTDADDDDVLEGEDAAPLRTPENAHLWYKVQRDIGMDFGPQFQKMLQVEMFSGERTARSLVSLEAAASKYSPQSAYPVHPAALDGCVQAAVPANSQGERILALDAMIPASIDEILINQIRPEQQPLHHGLAIAESVYSGRGRRDQPKNWIANTSVYDTADTKRLVVRITGTHYVKLDVPPRPEPHTFHGSFWRPDISFLRTQAQLQALLRASPAAHTPAPLDAVLDLVAYKKPTLRVLEAHLGATPDADASPLSLWFAPAEDSESTQARSAYGSYVFAAADAVTEATAETEYQARGGTSFLTLHPEHEDLGLAAEDGQVPQYDLAIVKVSGAVSPDAVQTTLARLNAFLAEGAFALVVGAGAAPTNGAATNGHTVSSLVASKLLEQALKAAVAGSGPVLAIPGSSATYLTVKTAPTPNVQGTLVVARLATTTPQSLPHSLQTSLEAAGWTVVHKTLPFSELGHGDAAGTTVYLVLDELYDATLVRVSQEQWDAVKTLVSSGQPILWLTHGAQGDDVTNPDDAMVHGLFRVARQEDGLAQLTTLDVQAATGQATNQAIEQVLAVLSQSSSSGSDVDSPAEKEYMERGGVLYAQRVIPDGPMQAFRQLEAGGGREPVVKGLHSTEARVQLQAERLGTLQSLTWTETETLPADKDGVAVLPALDEGYVEVEVVAAGVNFKDVAITMGIVPDNEYMLGLECGGIVRRRGPGVTKLQVGDRVCLLKGGCFSNRVRTSAERCHRIPDSMTFEEAATLPSVYLCSMYSLYHMANLRPGQSILIHSATGGVGIACIQLALYKKAEIYVTVGTEEKRKFLEDTYGIPRSRMFSSRSTKFASQVLRATNGRGVDVVINSLIGELLDASWRIVADGGNMVEIGKRDILDKNSLAMDPFDRNCSFRAVDLSFERVMDDKMIDVLLDELFVLINAGHLNPITPIITFPFDNIIGALSHIRTGRHIGKIVITTGGPDKDVSVPIRPAASPGLQLSASASYLIVGGLKGACGTLAIHLARHGARHLIISNRSGIQDPASARVVRSCQVYGCAVVEARGDVADYHTVRDVFASARPPIAGVIQGAMVLRDRPFETMTLDDYVTAVRPKVQGTWNLHRAAAEQQQLGAAPLAFFTSLASTAGIVGNKGQANYAAANTFLDAFARYRRARGLAANTVDLGLIEDVGYAAEQGTALTARFDTRLWTPINERALRAILTYSIFQQQDAAGAARGPINPATSAQLITGIAYPLPAGGATEVEHDPRFRYLFHPRAGAAGGAGADSEGGNAADDGVRTLQALLKNADADAKAVSEAGLAVVAGQFARTLRLEAEPDPGRPLIVYGLDSLSAVELRNWIRLKLGVELTTLDITNASSLLALTDKVLTKLQADGK